MFLLYIPIFIDKDSELTAIMHRHLFKESFKIVSHLSFKAIVFPGTILSLKLEKI